MERCRQYILDMCSRRKNCLPKLSTSPVDAHSVLEHVSMQEATPKKAAAQPGLQDIVACGLHLKIAEFLGGDFKGRDSGKCFRRFCTCCNRELYNLWAATEKSWADEIREHPTVMFHSQNVLIQLYAAWRDLLAVKLFRGVVHSVKVSCLP